MTQKVDPSVSIYDLEQKGEPAGSVPLERTIQKPLAYRKPSQTKLPKDKNP